MIQSRPKIDLRIAGMAAAADLLQAEVNRHKALWIENGITLEYLEACTDSFAHTGIQKCVDMIRAEITKSCKHNWVKVASSMAESQYKCAVCSEQDWH